jgi:hypothetical protein
MKHALMVLSALVLAACSSTDKKPDYTITFHALAGAEDPPKTKFPADINGRRMLFKVVPEFSQQNIAAFHAFPAESGGTKGIAIKLDFRGKAELEIISRTRKDEYLLAMVNAKPVDFVVLDEPVLDGIVTIWQGVTDDVIAKMDKKIPRIGKSKPGVNAADELEMTPTTKGEKKRAFETAKEAERAAKSGKPSKNKEPEVPSLNLPASPASPKLPVEGSPAPSPSPPVPAFRVPEGEPPLPKP